MMARWQRILVPTLVAMAVGWGITQSRGEGPTHLVPFPEDAAEQAAKPKPVKPAPPKSDFQPRFRAPNLKPAEPLEPVAKQDSAVVPASASEPVSEEPTEAIPLEDAPAGESAAETEANEGPQLLPAAEPVDPGALAGREALNEAYTRSKVASSESDYTTIIALCERGKRGVAKRYQDYAEQLMGWAYNRRGEARAKVGDEIQALTDFETAVRLSGAWRAIHNRGVSYAAAGRMEEALADFQRTIELNPRYPNAYYNRGELLYRQQNYPGAIEDYSMALELGKPDATTYNNRGHAFYRIQRFGDALRDYGEAIKLDPTNPDPLINRGDTNSDLGQYGEAAADYRAAVQIAPELGRAFQAAAWLMATCPDSHYRDEKLAVDAANRAIELDGPTFRNLTTLAAAQASAGQFDAAKSTQEQAIAVAPQEQVVTGEKMMALYQREIAFRDRPITSFSTPEETPESEIRQAAVNEFLDKIMPSKRAFFHGSESNPRQPAQAKPAPAGQYDGRYSAPPRQLPSASRPSQQDQRQPAAEPQQEQQRTRLFGPKGRI